MHIPAAVEEMSAKRSGDEVVITLTVPSKNIDGSIPVDIGRIEVYGYTGYVRSAAGQVSRGRHARRDGDGCHAEECRGRIAGTGPCGNVG